MGISGNGKTTVSRALAERIRAPHVELDAIYHQPGWKELPRDEFRSRVDEATRGDTWVVDGSYVDFVGDIVLGRADTAVWLDQQLPLVIWRLSRRAFRDIRTKRDLYNGNRQTLRFAFGGRDMLIPYAARQYRQRRRDWPVLFAAFPNLELVRLRSPDEVERWLEHQGDCGHAPDPDGGEGPG
jgi:adenylate kinase family enzyme